MFPAILFYVFAGVLIFAALGVILARNPVHSALLLVLCFFNSAVIWLLLDAEFLGIVLVLVYVGAVMVLFLFVVMMLDVNVEEFRKSLAGYWPLALAVAGFVIFAIINVIVVKHLGGITFRTAPALPADYSNTRALGAVLFTRYAYPAQIAALRAEDEFERLVTRAALVVQNVGVIDAALGDGMQVAIGVYQAAVSDLT